MSVILIFVKVRRTVIALIICHVSNVVRETDVMSVIPILVKVRRTVV